MQKVGLYLLIAMLGFALLFAFLPANDQVSAKTGAQLRDVQLTLYPARDPDAVWRFRAANVTNDPIGGITELSELSSGERLLREKVNGQYSGRETLDATLTTPHLTINGQDDLLTPAANITLVKQCADLKLSGTPEQPVRIQQGQGFSAALAELDSPSLKGRITNLLMDFDFNVMSSGQDSQFTGNLDATETCRDGRRVPLT